MTELKQFLESAKKARKHHEKYIWFPGNALVSFYDQMLARLEAMGDGWISVEDKYPDKEQEVLFTSLTVKDWDGNSVSPLVAYGWYRGDKQFGSFIDPKDIWRNITHWKPIPPPPQTK
jgi:hypothetical protein